jgi:hypothetical protein
MNKLATSSLLMPYTFKRKSTTRPFSRGFIAQVPSYYSAVPTGKRGRVRKLTALIVPKNCIKSLCLICCKIWSEHNVVICMYHVPKLGTWITIDNHCTARTDLGNSCQRLASRRAAPHRHLLRQTWHRFQSAPICLEYRTTQQIGRRALFCVQYAPALSTRWRKSGSAAARQFATTQPAVPPVGRLLHQKSVRVWGRKGEKRMAHCPRK